MVEENIDQSSKFIIFELHTNLDCLFFCPFHFTLVNFFFILIHSIYFLCTNLRSTHKIVEENKIHLIINIDFFFISFFSGCLKWNLFIAYLCRYSDMSCVCVHLHALYSFWIGIELDFFNAEYWIRFLFSMVK